MVDITSPSPAPTLRVFEKNHKLKKKERSRGQVGHWQSINGTAEDHLKGRLDAINQDKSGKLEQ